MSNSWLRDAYVYHFSDWDLLFCRFGEANGSMPILLSGVKCSSAHQLHTLRCKHNEIGSTSDCNHAHDVVLYCGKL